MVQVGPRGQDDSSREFQSGAETGPAIRDWSAVTFSHAPAPGRIAMEDFMATRITVVRNPNGQFQAWMCKHSSQAAHTAECDGHVVLCERCASAVRNGAELLNDENGQPVQPV